LIARAGRSNALEDLKHAMKTHLIYLLIVIAASCNRSTVLGAEPTTNAVDRVDPEWIYSRQYESYVYLLRFADLPEKERANVRKWAYSFFFQYWILHRSEYRQLTPVEKFEKSFAVLIKNHVLEFVDEDDPLEIRLRYKDGQYVSKPVPKVEGVTIVVPEAARLPQVPGLPGEQLRTWAGYQKYVGQYKAFLQSKIKQRLEELHLVPSPAGRTN
jgi:hypothetical protein